MNIDFDRVIDSIAQSGMTGCDLSREEDRDTDFLEDVLFRCTIMNRH
jgi:hypothetical protein